MVRLKIPPQQHRSTLCDDIRCGGEWSDVQWSADGAHLAFVSTSRDHRQETLRLADVPPAPCAMSFDEKVSTYFESGNGAVNWKYSATNEFIWFSERDNWGHLYLYDMTTGTLKNQITKGDWNVTRIARMDEKSAHLFVYGVGREKGRDPYFIHLYRVNFDGSRFALLTPGDGNHIVELSPSGKYFVDTYSKPDVPPVAEARDIDGKLIATLEKTDISKLLATGWKPPEPITVKARDGVTDLYGLMFKPSNLDPTKKYPIVNHIYPGPQTAAWAAVTFPPRAAIARLWPILDSSSSNSTAWARPGARRNSTRPTLATWATTRCRIR